MSEEPDSPEKIAEKRASAHRDLVRAYKRFGASEDGRRILADLEEKYGFDRDDFVYGGTAMDLAYRNGTKSPIRYIRKMRDMVLRPLGTKAPKVRAKSGLAPRR